MSPSSGLYLPSCCQPFGLVLFHTISNFTPPPNPFLVQSISRNGSVVRGLVHTRYSEGVRIRNAAIVEFGLGGGGKGRKFMKQKKEDQDLLCWSGKEGGGEKKKKKKFGTSNKKKKRTKYKATNLGQTRQK